MNRLRTDYSTWFYLDDYRSENIQFMLGNNNDHCNSETTILRFDINSGENTPSIANIVGDRGRQIRMVEICEPPCETLPNLDILPNLTILTVEHPNDRDISLEDFGKLSSLKSLCVDNVKKFPLSFPTQLRALMLRSEFRSDLSDDHYPYVSMPNPYAPIPKTMYSMLNLRFIFLMAYPLIIDNLNFALLPELIALQLSIVDAWPFCPIHLTCPLQLLTVRTNSLTCFPPCNLVRCCPFLIDFTFRNLNEDLFTVHIPSVKRTSHGFPSLLDLASRCIVLGIT